MKFAEYKGLNLTKVGEETLQFWKAQHIFEKSITTREGQENYVFYEGPPSANGMPGIHHVMARTIKDIFPRYKTMKGFQVKRKAGWDTHGLPIELGVEKELGITKEDIGVKISVEQYNEACKKAVMRYTDAWNDLTEKMGYWVDMDDPYITYKSKYMETVWWLLKQIYDKGLIYKGYTIQPYSPKAGTGLSSHELNMPGTYQDITDTTVTAQFKIVSSSLPQFLEPFKDELYFLAWTTTPWTLPSNTALTVGPKIEYVWVKTYNQYTFQPITVILAKNLVDQQFAGKFIEVENEGELLSFSKEDKKIPYFIQGSCIGEELEGIKYEQLIDYAKPYSNPENAFRVIAGDFVTTEDGTGIVHTAPTFGADDMQVAQKADPPVPPLLVLDENENAVPLVDLQGRFRKEMGDLAGKYVKNEYYEDGKAPERSVDVEIAIRLKEENKAFKVEKYVHSYPNCWRTDKPILYYPMDSWFIKITDVRERMYELNQTINWKPKATGEGRFGNWLASANDWNLSRSRFWGIPLPIWRTEDGKEEIIIGSVEQLKKEMSRSVEADLMKSEAFMDFEVGNMTEENYDKIDLHKNIVDQIVLVSDSGKPMKRENDLIDVWFDSGSMPYAQWHYPFENKELIDKRETFPADFIAEGVDQTRGWFYTLHAIATMVFDSVAYKNVVSNGLVLDKEGKKMSKRLGNAADPWMTIKEYGPDATRWYLISNANPWDNLKFDPEGIAEVKRKFFGTLYNTYSFFSLYANIDEFNYSEEEIRLENRPEIDQWILSELHTLIKRVDEAYDNYEPTRAARAIAYYVQENLSNWYVRLSRRRFWKGDYQEDKISAYQTLYTCLVTIAKLSAPIAPFFMDRLFIDLTRTTGIDLCESVHLSNFPEYKSSVGANHIFTCFIYSSERKD
jgi:isoleucyl-tRNA synthetase